MKATQRCIMMTKSRDPYLCSFISLFRVYIGRARTILTAIAINYRLKGIARHPLLFTCITYTESVLDGYVDKVIAF